MHARCETVDATQQPLVLGKVAVVSALCSRSLPRTRGNTRKVGAACAKEVLRTQLEAAEDYRFDAQLRGACGASVKSLCSGVEPGEGRELDCLVSKSG